MKFLNKQALNVVLDGEQLYTAQSDVQIRAFTVHNPTSNNVDLTIKIGEQVYVKKMVATAQTEVINALFNQQIAKDETMTVTGDELNVLLTVVEILN